ncbi:MAG TPA: pilus assembly protein PilB [Nitrospiraceae bacterium]|nr:pilus assembly protein PilB [Nitrospiraceae bacterium]
MTTYRRKRLGDILVAKGYVTQPQIDSVLARTDGREKRLGEMLLDEGLISEEVIAKTLAEQRDLHYTDLGNFRINPQFFEKIPVDLMERYQFVPVEETGETLVVAMTDPNNIVAIDEIEMILGKALDIRVSSPSAIIDALKRSGSSEHVLHSVSEDFKFHIVRDEDDREEVLSLESIDRDESPIIKLMHTTIFDAIQRRASDIHIESTDKNVMIKYRIDGVLYSATEPIDIKFHSAIVSRIKVMSDLDIAERRIPQDGRFKIRTGSKTIDFRVSILPSAFGEDVVIRILDKESITAGVNVLKLESLGFNENDLRPFRKSIREPYGMVLVTGPTGSGKTTTLYAAISEITTGEDKLITIEDPVEYQLRGVTQIPVNEKKGLTFAKGLRSILRHDPDKIMVGEIRDAETAQIAVQSALTGHLVFTTVHANNAFDVLGRFLNMGIEPYNFVSSLNCILAQRLVRTLCTKCKKQIRLTRQDCEDSALDYDQYGKHVFYDVVGCKECNYTGYRGRQSITEFLDLSDRIREMILERRPSSEIRKAAISEGMTTLRQSAVAKVLAGETTLKEINRVTFIE